MERYLCHQNYVQKLKQVAVALASIAIGTQCSSNLKPIISAQRVDTTKCLCENYNLPVTVANLGLYPMIHQTLGVGTYKAIVIECTNAINENVKKSNEVFRVDSRADGSQPNSFTIQNLHVRVHRF
jgi:hypothetical protein